MKTENREIQEAAHPGMSAPVRKKLAVNLRKDRQHLKTIKDPKQKEYQKNLSKLNATTYNPEVGKQHLNKTTPIAKKNNENYEKEISQKKDNSKMFEKNFIKMNMNENSTFRGRLLQEDAYGMPGQGGMLNDGKKNWKKYAAGAGLGALGVAANHVLGDGEGLDDAKDAYDADGVGGVKDHVLGRMQSGMDNLKAGDHNMYNNSDNSGDSSNDWKPNYDKLRNLGGDKGDGGFGIGDAGTGSDMTNLDKMNSMAFKHRDVEAGGWMPWQGSRPEYSTNMFGQADPNVTDDDIERHELNQIQQATKDAMVDGKMDAGEAKKIQDMLGNRTSERWFTQSDAADNLEAQRTQETQLGLDTAKRLGHDVLISGDAEARDQFFNEIKQRMGGIPKEYMGLYKDHMRMMAQR